MIGWRKTMGGVVVGLLGWAAPSAHAQEGPTAPAALSQAEAPVVPERPMSRWPRAAVVEAAPEPPRTFAVDRDARPRFTVAAVFRTGYLSDGGYQLFSGDDSAQGAGAVASYDVLSGTRAALGLGAGFLRESIAGRDDDVDPAFASPTRASFEALTLFGEARARWALLSWLQPHARVTGGATRGEMTVATSSGLRMNGDAWAPSGSAGAGLTFRSPPIRLMSIDGHPAFAFSLSIEGGYAFGGALKLDLAAERQIPEGGSAKDLIATQSVAAGDLSRSFPYAGGTLALHF